MEDTMVIMEKKTASFNYHVIGVFDGNNGDHVAVRAKEIIREIMSSSSSKQFFSSSDILMQHIFQTLTDEFSISKQAMTTGATATIGIIHRTFDTSMIEIHVGWVGDSTAVLLNLNNEKEKNIIFQTRRLNGEVISTIVGEDDVYDSGDDTVDAQVDALSTSGDGLRRRVVQ